MLKQTMLSTISQSYIRDTVPPLLISMLPRWNCETLIHVTMKETQNVPSNQKTCQQEGEMGGKAENIL